MPQYAFAGAAIGRADTPRRARYVRPAAVPASGAGLRALFCVLRSACRRKNMIRRHRISKTQRLNRCAQFFEFGLRTRPEQRCADAFGAARGKACLPANCAIGAICDKTPSPRFGFGSVFGFFRMYGPCRTIAIKKLKKQISARPNRKIKPNRSENPAKMRRNHPKNLRLRRQNRKKLKQKRQNPACAQARKIRKNRKMLRKNAKI